MPDPTPAPWLTPAQKNWLFMFLASVLTGLVMKILPGAPVPPAIPPELPAQVQQIAQDVKEIKAAGLTVLKK